VKGRRRRSDQDPFYLVILTHETEHKIMTTPLNRRDQDKIRAKIQGGELIRHLQAFALDMPIKINGAVPRVPKMTPHRIRAALGLLNKVLPDLKVTEIQAEVEHRKNVVSSEPLTEGEWEEKFGNDPKVTRLR
jgi:hypothetical protein